MPKAAAKPKSISAATAAANSKSKSKKTTKVVAEPAATTTDNKVATGKKAAAAAGTKQKKTPSTPAQPQQPHKNYLGLINRMALRICKVVAPKANLSQDACATLEDMASELYKQIFERASMLYGRRDQRRVIDVFDVSAAVRMLLPSHIYRPAIYQAAQLIASQRGTLNLMENVCDVTGLAARLRQDTEAEDDFAEADCKNDEDTAAAAAAMTPEQALVITEKNKAMVQHVHQLLTEAWLMEKESKDQAKTRAKARASTLASA